MLIVVPFSAYKDEKDTDLVIKCGAARFLVYMIVVRVRSSIIESAGERLHEVSTSWAQVSGLIPT